MTTVTTPAPTRAFELGDQVEIRRNLDHPAWKDQVEGDPRDIGPRWVRREGLDELIGTAEVTEVWLSTFRNAARASNGFWYEQATGQQQHSGATYIVLITD